MIIRMMQFYNIRSLVKMDLLYITQLTNCSSLASLWSMMMCAGAIMQTLGVSSLSSLFYCDVRSYGQQ